MTYVNLFLVSSFVEPSCLGISIGSVKVGLSLPTELMNVAICLIHYSSLTKVADHISSGSNPNGDRKWLQPRKTESNLPTQPSKLPKATDLLPGGSSYRGILGDNISENPRKGKAMSVWLHEWEQEWEKASRGHGSSR